MSHIPAILIVHDGRLGRALAGQKVLQVHTAGQSVGDADGVEDGFGLTEDLVQLLETPTGGLGEEEEDGGDEGGVEGGIDDEILIPDIGEGDRGHLGHEVVEEPGGGGGDAAHPGSEVDGRDLGGVEKRDAQEAYGVDDVVEEEEEDRRFQRAVIGRV